MEGIEGSEWTNLDGEGSCEEMGAPTNENTSLRNTIDTCINYCNSAV